MKFFRNRVWIKEFEYPHPSFDQIPAYIFNEKKERPDQVGSLNFLINTCICAWEMKVGIMKSLGSHSATKTKSPIEFIVAGEILRPSGYEYKKSSTQTII